VELTEIAGRRVAAGERTRVEIPVARLPSGTAMSLLCEVVQGSRPGPRLWLSAALHGDEIVGVEIVRRLLESIDPRKLRGAVIAVPIVNVFGFITQSRYLPDRRDLNRCFPGSRSGSLASRLAHLFMTEIVQRSTHGIDLHSGSNHRTNIPQVRADLSDPETRRCAETFAAPVMINAQTRDGSLRQAAARLGKPVLVYEAGEPLRFDNHAIRLGVDGVLRVMTRLGMLRPARRNRRPAVTEVASSSWVRARQSGVLRMQVELGELVRARQRLAVIGDVFGDEPLSIEAPFDGMIIGHTNNPLVYQGEAVVHVARPAPRSANEPEDS
jgi:predicted deacylase